MVLKKYARHIMFRAMYIVSTVGGLHYFPPFLNDIVFEALLT